MIDEAVKKLENTEGVKLSQRAAVVKETVITALCDFCRQNEEFAQAIAQSDKTVKDCLEATVKDVGQSISDIEVYRRAVSFWFEGATVHCTLTIDLGDGGFSNAPAAGEKKKPIKLDLAIDDLWG